ncbi:MAG: ATP-binding protein [Acetobacter sp.]
MKRLAIIIAPWGLPRFKRRILLAGACFLLCLCLLVLARALGPSHLANGGPQWAQLFQTARFLKQESLTDLNTPPQDTIPPDGPTGDWQQVSLPHTGTLRSGTLPDGQSSLIVTSWYRIVVTPPKSITTQTQDLAFYLPRWKTEGRLALYQNGHLLWHSHGDPIWNSFNRPVLVELPYSGTSTLLLRMDTMPQRGAGITQAWVGQYGAISWRYRARLTLQCIVPGILCVILLSMSIILFFVAIARPTNNLYLLFVFASILYTTRILHFMGPLDPSIFSAAWFGWATINSMCWLIVVGWLFCCGLAEVEFRWLKHLLVWGMVACTIATSPLLQSSINIAALALSAYIFCFVLSIPTMPLLFVAMWKRRSRSGILLLFWNMLMFPVAIHDMLLADYMVSIDHLYLLPYIVPDLFLSCLYILCRQYIDALSVAERANLVLETRLRAQELALRNSYEKLRQIEQIEVLNTERQRLMRDMHDGLGSTLTGAIHMTNNSAPHTLIAQTLNDCLSDLKLTVDSLEPVDADLLVLLSNLRFRLEPRLHAQGMTLTWAVTPLPPITWLTPSSALHILRILQEVVTNIIKHANAKNISVSTLVDTYGIIVCIEDDGQGFIPNLQASSGRGLHNIYCRAKILAASIAWKPRLPGTSFTMHLPIEQPAL